MESRWYRSTLARMGSKIRVREPDGLLRQRLSALSTEWFRSGVSGNGWVPNWDCSYDIGHCKALYKTIIYNMLRTATTRPLPRCHRLANCTAYRLRPIFRSAGNSSSRSRSATPQGVSMGLPATSDAKKATPGLSRVRQSSGHSQNRLGSLPQAVTEAYSSRKGIELGGRTGRIRVQVSAGNDLFREALRRALTRVDGLDVVGANSEGPTQAGSMVSDTADVLVLISRERLQEDLNAIRGVRASAPELKILFLGTVGEDGEFLQFVRAGISGFLRRDAPTEDIARAIENVHAGQAVCAGELCAALFRFFEDSEPRLPFGSPKQRLGLTRREQQIVPLIAKGFTNKEIANHFCLSEQTVKNHLYRMKHKVGAEDRLSIVQKFRHHGLLL